MEDFVNEPVMRKLLDGLKSSCRLSRDKYVTVMNDLPEAWSVGGALSYLGLGALVSSRHGTPVPTPEDASTAFAAL